MTLFACIAVFISCLGLLGAGRFTTERRKKEIQHSRKVLGASINGIVSLLSRSFTAGIAFYHHCHTGGSMVGYE